MKQRYVIEIGNKTRIYLECDEQPTFFHGDYEEGFPARLEIDGNMAMEFEFDATITRCG